MKVIDPLKSKMHTLLQSGVAAPLQQSLMGYGSKADYERLDREIRSASDPDHESTVIDLTPFRRLGNEETLGSVLQSAAGQFPLTILCVENAVLESLRKTPLLKSTQIAVYDSTGKLKGFEGKTPNAVLLEPTRRFLEASASLVEMRKSVGHEKLIELLTPGGIIYPYNGEGIPEDDLVYRQGRWFMRMKNGMLVSCYLHLKAALQHPEALSTIAYEVIYALYQQFRREPPVNRPCDVIVVPNNTALLIGAAVQAFTDIPVCVVDKLGPIPSRYLAHMQTSVPLQDKRVCLLVEVSGTGSEIDRSVLFLSSQRAQIDKLVVIACYSLEVGRSMLITHLQNTALCRPKLDLGYVYRSE
jgi:hypothetical protein